MAIQDNPLADQLINGPKTSKNGIRYCIKCGKQVLWINKDQDGNELPQNIKDFLWKMPLCLDCFRKGPDRKNSPIERSI